MKQIEQLVEDMGKSHTALLPDKTGSEFALKGSNSLFKEWLKKCRGLDFPSTVSLNWHINSLCFSKKSLFPKPLDQFLVFFTIVNTTSSGRLSRAGFVFSSSSWSSSIAAPLEEEGFSLDFTIALDRSKVSLFFMNRSSPFLSGLNNSKVQGRIEIMLRFVWFLVRKKKDYSLRRTQQQHATCHKCHPSEMIHNDFLQRN